MVQDPMEAYLCGDALYGDDFTLPEIKAWFEAEREGYAGLGAADNANYSYEYHAWNRFLGFRHLPKGRFHNVLGFGSAYGDELLPIVDRIDELTIVDPSESFEQRIVHGIPATYVKPVPSAVLPFDDGVFDLVTCLGVLHHVPNVTAAVTEIARVLRPGGHILLREPIVSMGDWRHPRRGLTRNERGIPLKILRVIVGNAGLRRVKSALCGFPVTERLLQMVGVDVYNNMAAVYLDRLVSQLFAWNVNYTARTTMQRLRPTSAFLVLTKPAAA